MWLCFFEYFSENQAQHGLIIELGRSHISNYILVSSTSSNGTYDAKL